MRVGNYKVTCVILTLLLCISGIFFENIKADTLFSDGAFSEENSLHCVIRDAGLCADDMLAVRSDHDITGVENGFRGQKGGESSLLVLLCFSLLISAFGKKFFAEKKVQFCEWYSNRHILTYIYQSDGKKRFASRGVSPIFI